VFDSQLETHESDWVGELKSEEEDEMPEDRTGVVTFKGNPVTLSGPEIKLGQPAPDFSVVDNGLQTVRFSDAVGKVLILSSVPSLDTPVCDKETRRFNEEASKLGDQVEVWTVSMDLPFAQKRWCGAADISRVRTLSDFRGSSFGQNYGVLIKDTALAGIDARAVFVVGKDGKIKHVEYVKEIANEPDYEAVLKAASEAVRA
jgi:thiol peroxidase